MSKGEIMDNRTRKNQLKIYLTDEEEIGNIVDINKNVKSKLSKGYGYWATKHNLKTAASTLVEIRNQGFN